MYRCQERASNNLAGLDRAPIVDCESGLRCSRQGKRLRLADVNSEISRKSPRMLSPDVHDLQFALINEELQEFGIGSLLGKYFLIP